MDLIIILLIALLFILPTIALRRQQNKQRQEIEQMQNSLVPGSRVVAAAGLHGTVVSVTEDTVDIEAAPGVVVTYEKALISRVLPDPSLAPQPEDLQQPGTTPDPTQGYRLPESEQSQNPDDHPENRN